MLDLDSIHLMRPLYLIPSVTFFSQIQTHQKGFLFIGMDRSELDLNEGDIHNHNRIYYIDLTTYIVCGGFISAT